MKVSKKPLNIIYMIVNMNQQYDMSYEMFISLLDAHYLTDKAQEHQGCVTCVKVA